MREFLKCFNPLVIARRFRQRKYDWADEGIKYHGFKYYPRSPDFKDPPYEPSKLFRVQRIKQLKGVPFYEKDILKEFGLAGLKRDVVVMKNTPENNQKLWKIKHLIQIRPITFPDGFPQDVKGTCLKENGELRVIKDIKIEDEKLNLSDEFRKNEERLDGDTLRRDSRKKWLDGWQ